MQGVTVQYSDHHGTRWSVSPRLTQETRVSKSHEIWDQINTQIQPILLAIKPAYLPWLYLLQVGTGALRFSCWRGFFWNLELFLTSGPTNGEQVNEKPAKRRPPKRTLIMQSAATYRLTNHFAVCSTSEIFVFVKPCSTRQRQASADLRATHLKDRHCMRTLSMNCTRWLKWKFGSNAGGLHGWHRCEQVKGSMHNQSRGWNPKSSHFNEAY